MRVTVSGPATGRREVDLTEGATAADLLAACAVDARTCFVVLRGTVVPQETRLHDLDQVQLYPQRAGG
jgi:sulfur carrier protein ThiS